MFLIISVIMIIMTSVNGTDISVTDSETKISHDYSDNQIIVKTTNNNQETKYKKDNNTINKITDASNSNKDKRVDKNINTQQTKTATPSTLTIGSTKNVYVNDNVAVYGKLSANGVNIPDAVVTIEANGQTYSVKTSKYGNYNTNVTISTFGTSKITATYYGSNSYSMSTNQTYVNVNKKTSLLTLGSTKNVYAGDKVNVYGKLTANGENVPNAKITIYADNKAYTALTTKYGNYNTNVTIYSAGNQVINATYAGSNVNTYDSEKTNVNVNKKSTLLTLGSTKKMFVDDKVTIYGKLTANGKNVPNEKIIIQVDGQATTLTTNKYGNYNTNITITSPGYKIITATYSGSKVYKSNTNNTYVNVNKKVSLLTIGSTDTVYVNEKISVYGKLTANGKNVPNEKITVKIDDKSYTATTSQYGNYKLNITSNTTGIKIITANYDGSNKIIGSNNYTDVNIVKKDTAITLGSTGTVYVGDSISIYGKLSSKGYGLSNKQVNIYVDNEVYTVTTNKYGDYNLKVTAEHTGTLPICADYDGSNIYFGCDSLNSYTKIVKKDTAITLGSTGTVYVGDSISIYGKLSSKGYGLSYKQVNIVVDNKEYTVTTNKYGDYNLKVTAEYTGTVDITAYYAGSNVYIESNLASHTTNVVKKDSTITLGSTSTVYIGDSISIYGKLSSRGYGLPNKQIKVDVNGKKYSVTTNKYGDYNLKVTANNLGTVNISSYYEGSNIYKGNNSLKTYTNVVKKDSTITLGSTSTVYIGDSISIYGKLSSKGNGLPNKQVTINVDGKEYKVTTNEYGDYNLKVTADYTGTWYINAKYAGSNIYYGTTCSTSYTKVTYKETSITLGSTKSVKIGGTINIYGRLSSKGYGLGYRTISINVDNKDYVTTTNQYGDYNLEITATSGGSKTIKANYYGSGVYKSCSNTTTTIVKKKSALTVNAIFTDEGVNIYGRLTSNDIGIAYQTVNLNIAGSKYTLTTSEYGYYDIDVTFSSFGNKKITASYYGNDYNTQSTASMTFNVKYLTLEMSLYKLNNGMYPTEIQVGDDLFSSWYQTRDGQHDKGAHVESMGYNPYTDRYSAPHYALVNAVFYFRDSDGDIYYDTYDMHYYYSHIGHTWVSGLTPYKVVVTYRKATSSERQ